MKNSTNTTTDPKNQKLVKLRFELVDESHSRSYQFTVNGVGFVEVPSINDAISLNDISFSTVVVGRCHEISNGNVYIAIDCCSKYQSELELLIVFANFRSAYTISDLRVDVPPPPYYVIYRELLAKYGDNVGVTQRLLDVVGNMSSIDASKLGITADKIDHPLEILAVLPDEFLNALRGL